MFGLQVVAQGIEREDQRHALAALGCELGQGYLLGRPLPPAAAACRCCERLAGPEGPDSPPPTRASRKGRDVSGEGRRTLRP